MKLWVWILPLVCGGALAAASKPKRVEPSPLERYVKESFEDASHRRGLSESERGSLWTPAAPLGDLARDPRASLPGDLVTILVSERASATSKGTTDTSRKSAAKYSVPALLGPRNATGALSDLARTASDTTLQGAGTTTRESVLTATLSARVTDVLPNGYLVIEGVKDTMVNSERQMITVRGVVRPADLSAGNLVRSDRVAQLELRINGKGVVGDAIRRPFFLYRLIMGFLPF